MSFTSFSSQSKLKNYRNKLTTIIYFLLMSHIYFRKYFYFYTYLWQSQLYLYIYNFREDPPASQELSKFTSNQYELAAPIYLNRSSRQSYHRKTRESFPRSVVYTPQISYAFRSKAKFIKPEARSIEESVLRKGRTRLQIHHCVLLRTLSVKSIQGKVV